MLSIMYYLALYVHVSPEAGGVKLPEAKKKEAAADINEGWDDEEWEVSDRVLWWHKDSEALQFDHGVWLAFCQVSLSVLCMSESFE